MGAGVAMVESIPLAGLECCRCICLPPTGSWCLRCICCAQCTCMNGASALHLLCLVHLQDSGICFASVVPYRMQGLSVCLASVVPSPPAGFKCVPCICCAHTGCKSGMFQLRSIQSARRQTFVLQLFSPHHLRGHPQWAIALHWLNAYDLHGLGIGHTVVQLACNLQVTASQQT